MQQAGGDTGSFLFSGIEKNDRDISQGELAEQG